MTATTDVIRRVFTEDEDFYLEVGPWPESPNDTVELRTTDDRNHEYFGTTHIPMTRDFAIALGNALIAAAKEAA